MLEKAVCMGGQDRAHIRTCQCAHVAVCTGVANLVWAPGLSSVGLHPLLTTVSYKQSLNNERLIAYSQLDIGETLSRPLINTWPTS